MAGPVSLRWIIMVRRCFACRKRNLIDTCYLLLLLLLCLLHVCSLFALTLPFIVQTKKSLSGTKFRKMLRGGDDIPEWFAFKSVVDVLRAN